MLSMYDNEQYLFEALKAGASGYVLKTAADRDLVQACRATMRGEPFLYPAAVTPWSPTTWRASEPVTTLARSAHPARAPGRQADRRGLDQRWHRGGTRHQPRTVDRHRENILSKLGMRDRVELTRYAIRRGLVEP